MPSVSLAAARQKVADRLAGGDLDGAQAGIETITARFPDDYRTAVLAGRAMLAVGDEQGALLAFRRAAEAAPDDAAACAGLARCGDDLGRSILTDLAPLRPADGERPRISAAALGRLYLEQLLLTHCTAQLLPLWQAQRQRLDVGLALAEAHWRLGEAAADEVCRAILEAAPRCLKANLILGQRLCAAGRRDQAEPFLAAARAVDPESDLAEELYEWLRVRDEDLVPLRHGGVVVDFPELSGLPEPALAAAEPWLLPPSEPEVVVTRGLAPTIVAPRLPPPVIESPAPLVAPGPGRMSPAIGGIEPMPGIPELFPHEPASAPRPSLSPAVTEEPAECEMPALRHGEADTEPDESLGREGWPTQPTAPGPAATAAPPEAATGALSGALESSAPEADSEPTVPAPPASGWPAETTAPDPGLTAAAASAEPDWQAEEAAQKSAAGPPAASAEPDWRAEAAASESAAGAAAASAELGWPTEAAAQEPTGSRAQAGEAVASAAEPAVAETGPEPALAPIAAQAEPAPLAIFDVSSRGQLSAANLTPSVRRAYERRADAWNDACRQIGLRLKMGAVHASSIESARGAVQLSHEDRVSAMAVAPTGANLGLVRAKLRQQTSEEHHPT